MKEIYKLSFLICVFLLTFSVNGQSKNSYELKIESFLNNLTKDEFSGTILVAHNDKILDKRAYGFANIEYQVKNNVDTKFNIASITKMFTAVATLQLYEQGKLELNVPIGKYLPNYPNKTIKESVTIHQLLTHTSGTNNNFPEGNSLKYKKVSDFADFFVNDTLLFKPGIEYSYSGSGFVVLGLIIEKVSGKSYYEYVDEHIFKPANMTNTVALEVDSIVKNKASGYTSTFGESKTLRKNEYYLMKTMPAGFHYSTLEDLFNFSKALRHYQLLNKKTTELMFKPKVKGYNTHLGYGIDVDNRYNQTILGHSGGWYGIHTELMDFMDDDYTIVILSNIDDGGKKGASIVADFFKELIADKK
ncbi:serine hydrolase [Galbibacter sp. EGI 63066]|uniref:serine hydrolase domain-containing protein n=1 Tax=Galbibacter sp. EGI 63066 TaxID=2993559 RepID=UPI0022488BC5|nr:serine hydrolase domain-containing protein [Galbibacter sp. EGI 63066]MCX2681715.1 serine hydrolase [Galbibacter sp. EGI 63066]